jgi:hypothetical protein
VERLKNARPVPDAASLLADAGQRSDGPGRSLSDSLLDNVHESFSASFVHLWRRENSSGNVVSVLRRRGNDPGCPDCVATALSGRYQSSENPGTGFSHRLFSHTAAASVAEHVTLVLEVGTSEPVESGETLIELAEIFADLYRRDLLNDLLQTSSANEQLQKFVQFVYRAGDVNGIAHCLANDAVPILRCQRISIARKTSEAWQIIAATGVSNAEPRADATRLLIHIIDSAEHGQQISHTGSGIAPVSVAVPLSPDSGWKNCEWAAVLEWPDSATQKSRVAFIQPVVMHATQALEAISRHVQQGFAGTLRRLIRVRKHTFRLLLISTAVVTLPILWLMPAPFRIEVRGSLVPAERQLVFAPEDGTVVSVAISDGDPITLGQELCQLRNEELELQGETLEGEFAATQARLAALESLRTDRIGAQSGLISAEQAELRERLASLADQQKILQDRMATLKVVAAIPGRAFGERLRESLTGRPVERGQYLLELANPEAGWMIDFRIPESEARHVPFNSAQSGSAVSVHFVLESDPNRTRTAQLTNISPAVEVDAFGELSTRATALPDPSELTSPRPGAGVIGQIDCGQRSLGFVLFRRLIEALQRWWF